MTPESALPGWTALIGGVPAASIEFNDSSLGTAYIDLFGPGVNPGNGGVPPIDGNYSVELQGGFGPQSSELAASIYQTGTIPANAQSLQFKSLNAGFGSPLLTVTFSGISLPVELLGTGQGASGLTYSLYGADIAPYANQAGQLEFTAAFNNWIELDDIAFSTTAVPEPNPLILTGIGGIVFGLYRRFAPNSKSK